MAFGTLDSHVQALTRYDSKIDIVTLPVVMRHHQKEINQTYDENIYLKIKIGANW